MHDPTSPYTRVFMSHVSPVSERTFGVVEIMKTRIEPELRARNDVTGLV
jgi:hypothetical protein